MDSINSDDLDSAVPVFEEAGPGGFQHSEEARVPHRREFLSAPTRRRRLLLGVTGTEGAIHISSLVDQLLDTVDVWVICTKDSSMFFRKIFVSRTALVFTDDDVTSTWTVGRASLHEMLCDWADFICVVPASADLLSRVAVGFSDDLLTRTIRGFTGRVFLVLDMDPDTYRNEVTAQHVAIVRGRRYVVRSPPPSTANHHPTGSMGGMADVRDWIVNSMNS